ncbi:MAG: hypothetical protein HPPSJP_1890 [Candidatus Hepatoplasma scabrum]|nr:MAG: hypothetical protein HPPSJP_1890 [Candidatus Hepatoplasma sp.]
MNNFDNYIFGVIDFAKGNEIVVKSNKEKILQRNYIIGLDQLFLAPRIDRFIKFLFNNQIFIYKIFQIEENEKNIFYRCYYVGRLINNKVIENETFIAKLNEKVSLISIKELKQFDQNFANDRLRILNIAKTLDTENEIDLNLNFFSSNNILLGKKGSGKSNTIKNLYLAFFNQYLKSFNQKFHKFIFFDLKNQYHAFFENNLNSSLLPQLIKVDLKERLEQSDVAFFNFKKLSKKELAFIFNLSTEEEKKLLYNFLIWIENLKQISFIKIINEAILIDRSFEIVKVFLLKLLKISTKEQNLKFNHYFIILQEILNKLSLDNNLFILNDAYDQYSNFIAKEKNKNINYKKKGNNLYFEKDHFNLFLDLIKGKYLNLENDKNLLERFNNFINYDFNSLLILFQLQTIIDNDKLDNFILNEFIDKLTLKKDNDNYLIIKHFALNLKGYEKQNDILSSFEKNNLIILTFDYLSIKVKKRLIYLLLKLLTIENCLDLPEEKRYLNIILDDFDHFFELSLITKNLDLILFEKLILQKAIYKTFFTIAVENVNLLREKIFADFDNFLIHQILDREELELTTHYLKNVNEHQLMQTFKFKNTEAIFYGKSFKRLYPVELLDFSEKKVINNESSKVIFDILNQKSQ